MQELSDFSRLWGRVGRYSILALVFLLPLVFISFRSNPFEIHKEVLSIILLLVALSGWVAMVIGERTIRYPSSFLTWGVVAMLLAALISSIFSIAGKESFYNGFTNPDALIPFFLYALSYFLGAVLMRKKDIGTLGNVFIASSSLAAIVGILQIFGIFILPSAITKFSGFNTLGSVIVLGIIMAAALAYIVSMPWKGMGRARTYLIFGAGILMFGGLLVLNEHLLWLGLAIFLFVLAAIRFSREEHTHFLMAFGGIALLLFLISSHLPTLSSVPREVRPTLELSFSVAKNTLDSWRVVTGSGPGTFGRDFELIKPVSLNQGDFWNMQFPAGFNFLVTILTTQGLLGFLASLFILFGFLNLAFKEPHPGTDGLFGLTFMVFILWFMYPMAFVPSILLFLGLGALVSSLEKSREISLGTASKTRTFNIISAAIVLLALVISLVFFAGEKYVAAAYFEKGLRALNGGDAASALENMSRSLNLDGGRDAYWRVVSQALLLEAKEQISQDKSELVPQIQGELDNAIQAAKRAGALNPGEALNWENLGNVYESLIGVLSGAENFAKDSYSEAMKLKPQDPLLPLETGRAFLVASKFADAGQWLQKSVELKPDFTDAHFLLAQLYIKQGDVDKGIRKVEEIKAQNPFDTNVAFQLGLLYYQTNQFGLAQSEFERAVALYANFSNARYFLGLTYDRRGQKDKAIQEFKKIAELNPENNEVKAILANLRSGKAALSGILPAGQTPQTRSDLPVATGTSTIPR